MTATPEHSAAPAGWLADGLARLAPALDPDATGVSDIHRISGGASHEIWGFTLDGPGTRLILRRKPDAGRHGVTAVGPALEAVLVERSGRAGAPVPGVLRVCAPGDGLGEAYVMTRIDGEALPKRVLRGAALAPARARFAADAGRALAAIHATRAVDLPLRQMTPLDAVEDLARRHGAVGDARPVFELALCHLADTAPPPEPGCACLVHGDFRIGNLMFGPEGLRAVLDWEMAFHGDRHADFGWLCMESWRYGGRQPAGGIASRADLAAAYEAASGAPVDRARLRWWEVWSALCWGVITTEMGVWVREGSDRSVERHVIARRASECELILMAHLTGRTE